MTVLFRMGRYSHSRGIAKYLPLNPIERLMTKHATADSPERVLPIAGPRGMAIQSLQGWMDMVQIVTAANRLGVSKGTMIMGRKSMPAAAVEQLPTINTLLLYTLHSSVDSVSP